MLAQDLGGGNRLQRHHVTGAGDDDVRICPRIEILVPGPIPNAVSALAVIVGFLLREPLELRLLVLHDEVHAILRFEGVGSDLQQTVGVRRQIHANNVPAQVHHGGEHAGPLMGESVVIVAPTRGGQQHVERGDRRAPREPHAFFEPLGVLDSLGDAHHPKGFIGGEHSVAPGQIVALEPPVRVVLGEHLHHTPAGGELDVQIIRLFHEGTIRYVEHRSQPVGIGFVRAEQAESLRIPPVDLRHELAEAACGFLEERAALFR